MNLSHLLSVMNSNVSSVSSMKKYKLSLSISRLKAGSNSRPAHVPIQLVSWSLLSIESNAASDVTASGQIECVHNSQRIYSFFNVKSNCGKNIILGTDPNEFEKNVIIESILPSQSKALNLKIRI